jgi:predicted Co/Zn/Cd cation transporter (cation efflux family)
MSPSSAVSEVERSPAQREAAALRVSAAAALVLAGVGIVWGLAVDSAAILFDGIFAVIGFVLSWFGLRAAALVERGPTPSYPFGREALAPLVVAVQALVLAGTFGYAALDAIDVILDGGSQTQVGPALVYSVLALGASIVITVLLARRQEGSDLVVAEVAQWRASVVLGAALAAGFAIALGLGAAGADRAAGYVDPILVLLAAALVLPTPVRMLRTAFRELLEGTPDASVTGPIDDAVAEVRAQFGLPEPTARVGKLGRKVYLELDFLVGADEGWGVDHADRIRRALLTRLARPGQLLWINVELHTDPGWDA